MVRDYGFIIFLSCLLDQNSSYRSFLVIHSLFILVISLLLLVQVFFWCSLSIPVQVVAPKRKKLWHKLQQGKHVLVPKILLLKMLSR